VAAVLDRFVAYSYDHVDIHLNHFLEAGWIVSLPVLLALVAVIKTKCGFNHTVNMAECLYECMMVLYFS